MAASSSDSGVTKRQRLPIFPLGLVALPGTNVPLQIFEARYRVLFSTLLDGSDGIDQGLVSPDKPWRGTRRFGMVLYDSNAGGLATVGTVLEVVDHSTMDDGRLLVQTIGRERFKISEVVEERPILVCDVELLNDAEMLNEDPEKAKELADQIGTLFREMVKLTVKLRGSTVPDEVQDPVELRTLAPRELSFWVASLFGGNPYNQQALLEEDCTMKRLKVEEELLSETLKYLSAQAAVKSAFGSEPDQKSE